MIKTTGFTKPQPPRTTKTPLQNHYKLHKKPFKNPKNPWIKSQKEPPICFWLRFSPHRQATVRTPGWCPPGASSAATAWALRSRPQLRIQLGLAQNEPKNNSQLGLLVGWPKNQRNQRNQRNEGNQGSQMGRQMALVGYQEKYTTSGLSFGSNQGTRGYSWVELAFPSAKKKGCKLNNPHEQSTRVSVETLVFIPQPFFQHFETLHLLRPSQTASCLHHQMYHGRCWEGHLQGSHPGRWKNEGQKDLKKGRSNIASKDPYFIFLKL